MTFNMFTEKYQYILCYPKATRVKAVTVTL